MMFHSIIYYYSTWILPILFSITLHEAAHGFVAWELGDDTAYRIGRLSFNPFRHVDLIGTVMLPAFLLALQAPFLFGWAKPVPVVSRNLRFSPRLGMICVAISGPISNILLAVFFALFTHVTVYMPIGSQAWILLNIQHAIQLNVMLALFNMLPIPPLDGGLVLFKFLPRFLTKKLFFIEKYGILVIFVIVLIIPTVGNQIGEDWNLLIWFLGPLATLLHQLILNSTGLETTFCRAMLCVA